MITKIDIFIAFVSLSAALIALIGNNLIGLPILMALNIITLGVFIQKKYYITSIMFGIVLSFYIYYIITILRVEYTLLFF